MKLMPLLLLISTISFAQDNILSYPYYNGSMGEVYFHVNVNGTNRRVDTSFITKLARLVSGTNSASFTLTTSGTTGPATLIGSVLNIPQYAGGGTTYTGTTPGTVAAGAAAQFQSTGANWIKIN